MRRISVCWLALLLSACAGTGGERPEVLPQKDLARGAYSALRFERTQVIRDTATLAQFWERARVRDPLPAVDFSQRMVIIAALGERRTGGYRIDIEKVLATDTGVRVQIQASTPGEACMVTQALTQPFHIVSVPAHSGPVAFDIEHTTVECGG